MEFALELESHPRASSRARRAISRRLGGEIGDALLQDLLLVVTELVTNSVRYGPGKPVVVRIAVDEGGPLRGEVEDQGDGEVAIREMIDDEGGRGLRIVEALTDRWAVYEGSTHVWFEMSGRGEAAK